MSLYEALAFAVLAAVGSYAYYLYRSDIRRPSPGPQARDGEVADNQLMFKRTPQDRAGDVTRPGTRD